MKTNKAQDILWYTHPAKRWLDALPLGNGNIGAMVYSDTACDTISFGEASIWSGRTAPEINKDGEEILPLARQLILNGNNAQADELLRNKLRPETYGKPSDPTYGTHLPAGKLKLSCSDTSNYREYYRELNMAEGLIHASYSTEHNHYDKEYLCSNPHGIFAMYAASDKPVAKYELYFENPSQNLSVTNSNPDELCIKYQALETVHSAGDCGVNVQIIIKVLSNASKTMFCNDRLIINDASELIIYTAIETDFDGADYQSISRKKIDAAVLSTYNSIKEASILDFYSLYCRNSLTLGTDTHKDEIPTDERIKAFINGTDDLVLIMKFYQLARYLLIASSRNDSKLPPSLQGNWTDNIASNMPWADDFHIDINTQQNYWQSEAGNLSECNIALFKFIDRVVTQGRYIAQKTYHCRGWCTHITIDGFGNSPFNHCGCPTIGLWLISHLWEHYLYTQDNDFLKNQAYPILKEAAEFILDFLTVDPETGYLVTNPSYSPENGFVDPATNLRTTFTYGPTGDTVMITGLFDSLIESSRILNIDKDFSLLLEETKKKLPPFRIGSKGQLLEWIKEYQEFEPGHRHTQHLLSVYPYCQITEEKTPELFKAARESIRLRLETLFDTEWTRGNMMNFFARYKEGDNCWEQLRNLFKRWIIGDSMFTTSHNDDPPFVMDGNTSCAAGLIEMLMQSHDNYIRLLPASCRQTQTGALTGVCARGGFTLDFCWDNNLVNKLFVLSKAGCQFTIDLDHLMPVSAVLCDGRKIDYAVLDNRLNFNTQKGKSYQFEFIM